MKPAMSTSSNKSTTVNRTGNQKGLHAFESLSHGTREQVALTLRLAMAELFAADYDDCLPLILDDAFTRKTIAALVRMRLTYKLSIN